ncbi:MAG: hypothetical protein M0Z53_01475 [Thermaerobacter sp.]|nr:hypothetical protein [Thermaerobacter sp.]
MRSVARPHACLQYSTAASGVGSANRGHRQSPLPADCSQPHGRGNAATRPPGTPTAAAAEQFSWQELGPAYHDARNRSQIVTRTVRQLERLGYRVIVEPQAMAADTV